MWRPRAESNRQRGVTKYTRIKRTQSPPFRAKMRQRAPSAAVCRVDSHEQTAACIHEKILTYRNTVARRGVEPRGVGTSYTLN